MECCQNCFFGFLEWLPKLITFKGSNDSVSSSKESITNSQGLIQQQTYKKNHWLSLVNSFYGARSQETLSMTYLNSFRIKNEYNDMNRLLKMSPKVV